MNAARPTIDPFADLTGMLADVGQIAERLADIAQRCHLISPRATCVALKPGCAVSFDAVMINPRVEAYPLKSGGGYALKGQALFRLANAAGIVWNGEGSYRADPGTHADYCHWHAEGGLLDLDGTMIPQDDDFRMDMRDGSAQYLKCFDEARGDTEQEREAKARRTIMQKRAKLLELAETGAKLRVIRKLLPIRSYAAEELALPFIVARLVYLGHDEDPEIERDNKRAIRDHMLGGARALFGNGPRVRHLPSPPARAIAALPPVGTVTDDLDEDLPAPEPPRAKPLPVCCDYCGTEDKVTARTTANGVVKHCARPLCLELALNDATRASESPAAGTTATHAASGGSTAPRAAGTSYPQGSPSPAGRRGAPGASRPAVHPPTAQASAPGAPRGPSGFVVPGHGRDGGKPIERAEDRTLKQWIQTLARSLANGKTPPRFIDNDQRLLAGMKAELARRQAADAEQPGEPEGEGCGEGEDTIPY